jgi:hypothetical protein
LEPLQQLEARDPILIDGDNLPIENVVERSFNLDTAFAMAGNFASNARPFRDRV